MNEIKKLEARVQELKNEREIELERRRRMCSDPRRQHSFGHFETFKRQVDERYDTMISPILKQIDELKHYQLLSDLADDIDEDSGESVGSSFSHNMSRNLCTDSHHEGISSYAANNELASDDDDSSDQSDGVTFDVDSTSAKKRKWASVDVIEIDSSSSDSESLSNESEDEDEDDDVIEIISQSDDLDDSNNNDDDDDDDGDDNDRLLLVGGKNDEAYHSDHDSEFNGSQNEDADYESSMDESYDDGEGEENGEEMSYTHNEHDNDSTIDNNEHEEVANITNNNESGSHNDTADILNDSEDESVRESDNYTDSDNYGDEDDSDGEIERFHVSKIRRSRLTMVTQGFRCQANTRRSLAAKDCDRTDCTTKISNNSDTPFDPATVEFHGKTYRKNRCYVLKGRDAVTVGVKHFLTNDTAKCVLIVKFDDTILGIEDEGSEYNADYNMMGQYVQVHNRIETISLSEFQREANDVTCIPNLIYQDQTPGTWHTFGYFHDRAELMQRRGKKRQELRLLEVFAGAGGSMLGYKNNGFVTVMAVENNSEAVATLKLNNPEVKVYEGCIRKFMNDFETLKCALGRIDHIHFSSPCQDFSRANRHQTKGSKRDRADLSLLLVDLVRMTSCSTAVFENVVGIFDRNNVSYIKNISKGLLLLGYQIRCTCLHACDYGDPQKRPRIVMFIAKKSVPMPSFPAPTHGSRSGWRFVTVKQALTRVRNDNSLPNMNGRAVSSVPGQHGYVRLIPNDCAPTIRASSVTPFHYLENRCINVREAACLQSFPIDYKFLGSLGSQYRQVGNAVPIELATAIAQSIRQILMNEYNNDSDVE